MSGIGNLPSNYKQTEQAAFSQSNDKDEKQPASGTLLPSVNASNISDAKSSGLSVPIRFCIIGSKRLICLTLSL